MDFIDLKIGDKVIKSVNQKGIQFVKITHISLLKISFSDGISIALFNSEFLTKSLTTKVLCIMINDDLFEYTTTEIDFNNRYDVFNLTKKYFSIYDETVTQDNDIITKKYWRWYRIKMYCFKWENGVWIKQKNFVEPKDQIVFNYKQFMEIKNGNAPIEWYH